MPRARKKKVVEENNDRVVVERYVAPIKALSFVVPEEDEKGNKIPKLDPLTGIHIRIDDRPQYQERLLKFTNIVSNVQKGCLCEYIVYEDTSESIKERLEEMCDDPQSSVMTREDWIQIHNRPQWEEIQRRKAVEKEAYERGLADASKGVKADPKAKARLEAQDKIIADLQAQVRELEKGQD